MGKRKPRNVVLFTKTSQNTGFSCFLLKIPPKHKRRTPRGGRRTCYLVVVVVAVPVAVVVVFARHRFSEPSMLLFCEVGGLDYNEHVGQRDERSSW